MPTRRTESPPPRRVARVHCRERLFRLLDRARARRVVWVEASPGSGKSTLLASWVRSRRLRALWHSHACGDDVAGFFRRLAAAARARGFGHDLPAFRPAHLLAIRPYGRRFFEALTSEHAPDVLVLDDHHAIGRDSLLHLALASGIEAMAPGTTVVVASRAAPPPEFAHLRAAGELAELPGQALALTRREAREVARLRGGGALPDAILSLCGGWAAGVVLLSAAYAQRRSIERAREYVVEYLAAEVFDAIEPRDREVLLRTCLLPTVDEPSAVRLSGIAEAGRVLDRLARAGWLVERWRGPATYRVHALLREFLIGRAREVLGRDGFAAQVRAATSVALDAGDVDAAATVLVAERDWGGLARMLVAHGPALAEAGRLEAMDRWLEALPPSHRVSPWLRFWRGVSLFARDAATALAELEGAFEAFAREGDRHGTWRSWAAAVELRLCALDELAGIPRLLDALPRLRERLPFPDAATEAAVTASAVCAYGHVRAVDPAAREWDDRAFELVVSPGEPALRLRVGCHLGIRCALWGTNLVRARVVLDAVRGLATARDAEAMHAVLWHAGEASYHAHLGDAAATIEAADRGLAAAARAGLHLWDPVLRSLRVLGALAGEDLRSASQELATIAGLLERGGRLATWAYQYTAGCVALRRGAVGEALERARAAAQLGADAGCALSASGALALWAAAAASGGGPGPALADAEAAARASGNGVAELGAALLRAHTLLDRDEAQAERVLRGALALARRLGALNVATVSRAQLADLCALALERDLEPELARTIIRARSLDPGPRARSVAAWPWPTRVETLGGLSLHSASANGARKEHRKPLELLRLLVVHGQRGAALDRLAEDLWPEADGDTARHALETTIYRLRRLLGDPASVVRRDGVAALDASRVFVDAWAFEALATQAEAKRASGLVADAARAGAAARRLYQGDLLPGDECPPVAFARARLRARAGRLARLPSPPGA